MREAGSSSRHAAHEAALRARRWLIENNETARKGEEARGILNTAVCRSERTPARSHNGKCIQRYWRNWLTAGEKLPCVAAAAFRGPRKRRSGKYRKKKKKRRKKKPSKVPGSIPRAATWNGASPSPYDLDRGDPQVPTDREHDELVAINYCSTDDFAGPAAGQSRPNTAWREERTRKRCYLSLLPTKTILKSSGAIGIYALA